MPKKGVARRNGISSRFRLLPRTIADDGDPIDVLLLMDEPAFTGCAVRAVLIGVIEGEQHEGKKKTRNDRLLAVAEANHMYSNILNLWDLPKQFLDELQDCFVNFATQFEVTGDR